MSENEKLGENAISTDSKTLKRLENYWYHYKWPTIIVCFFAIVVIVCSVQMCGKKSQDLTIVYAGPYQMEPSKAADVKNVLNFVMPEDYDKDGEKNVQLVNYMILTKEQIEKTEAESSQFVDRSYVANENKNFFNYAATEAGICFLDPSLYQSLKESDRLVDITDLLGYSPEGLVDKYGVKLSQTGIYNEYAVLRELPEDTVVCILRKQLAKKDELHKAELDTFKAIINYNRTEK